MLILIEEEPPEGLADVVVHVLDNAYYVKGHPYRECVEFGKTKIEIAVTGKEDFSAAFIVASAKTHFPEIDVSKIRINKFSMVYEGRKRSGVIISD